ncbi:imm11 family protein [Bradyrhizobium forestalis]|nr:DUF1629 domain-containing protein [Bradyrhizobium forestalis]
MAYIIRDDLSYSLGKTEVEFFQEDKPPLDAFFDRTDAYPGTIIRATWVSGTILSPDVMPRRVRLIRGEAMYDWLVVRGGATLVSSRFRDAVEQLDPGRHQFFPVVVEDKKGRAWPGSFFIFNVVGRIDSIIEDRSSFKVTGRGQIENWSYQRVGPWQCTLNATVIGDRACWIEHHHSECWFISDRLAALLQERGLTGFRLDERSDEITR